MLKERTAGYWTIMVIGILLLLELCIGQAMAWINYEFAVSIGLQESMEKVGETLVAVNKGFGVGDTIVYIPILILGLIGLWLRTNWGVTAMIAAMGITVYWPVTCMYILLYARGIPGFNFTDFCSYGIILSAISCFGIWGMWYLNKNSKKLIKT
ncbi:MAG: hypothetical protein HQK83_00025 [Fibrobacteria bacterium]|nr:hypothetical protein [Fibrobacteria bacterium]